MGIADRVRTIWWLRPAITISAAGVVVLIVARTIAAVSAHGAQLNVLVNEATIVGTALTSAGAALSLAAFARSRMSPNVTPVSASTELLRTRVRDYEQNVKIALLRGLTPSHGVVLTFHGWTPKELLRYRDAGPVGAKDGKLTRIGAYYRELRESGESRLLVLGPPGSGKTVLAVELILQLLRKDSESAAASGTAGKIPVRFSITGWTTGTKLPEWLVGRLTAEYAIPPKEANQLVKEGLLLPVLDGLDEMDPELDLDEMGPELDLDEMGPELDLDEMKWAWAWRAGMRFNRAPRAAAFLRALNGYAEGGNSPRSC